jgi:hypothetical protein
VELITIISNDNGFLSQPHVQAFLMLLSLFLLSSLGWVLGFLSLRKMMLLLLILAIRKQTMEKGSSTNITSQCICFRSNEFKRF